MTPEENDWQAPEVTPITEADGASGNASARVRNGISLVG
jgi:hypothetical protein